jgi:3-methyl-2-oxobutanoate hydroxymethyltransferase
MSEPSVERVTVPGLRARKEAGEKIVVLTAYDHPTAGILDRAGVDILLVGDSLGMAVLGYENTLAVTMEEMLHHVKPVARAARRALVVADMPYLSFHVSPAETIRNGGRFLKEAGAHAVKIEGSSPARLDLVHGLVEAEIPVMGHVGLTPQSINRFGSFKVRGSQAEEAASIVRGAEALQEAGAFAIVLECVPLEVASEATARLKIPTIGIGAGPHCDGQVLVFHDLVGLTRGEGPKFVRRYGDLEAVVGKAVRRYAEDVRGGAFPADEQSYHLKSEVHARLKSILAGRKRKS